jgi:hypothetical protein
LAFPVVEDGKGAHYDLPSISEPTAKSLTPACYRAIQVASRWRKTSLSGFWEIWVAEQNDWKSMFSALKRMVARQRLRSQYSTVAAQQRKVGYDRQSIWWYKSVPVFLSVGAGVAATVLPSVPAALRGFILNSSSQVFQSTSSVVEHLPWQGGAGYNSQEEEMNRTSLDMLSNIQRSSEDSIDASLEDLKRSIMSAHDFRRDIDTKRDNLMLSLAQNMA